MTTKLRAASLDNNIITTSHLHTNFSVDSDKIAANAIGPSELNQTANYTFTGTVAGASSIKVISNSSTGATNVSSIEIDLDTSGDYRYQELHLHQAYHHTECYQRAFYLL